MRKLRAATAGVVTFWLGAAVGALAGWLLFVPGLVSDRCEGCDTTGPVSEVPHSTLSPGTHARSSGASSPEGRECPAPDQQVVELSSALRICEQGAASLYEEVYGKPRKWDADVPDEFRPEAFEKRVRDAVARCTPSFDLEDIDCSEPPCLAVLRENEGGNWNDFVNECVEWYEAYGNSVTVFAADAQCGDGTTEHVVLLGPAGGEPSTNDRDNGLKRLNYRRSMAVANWQCEAAGR